MTARHAAGGLHIVRIAYAFNTTTTTPEVSCAGYLALKSPYTASDFETEAVELEYK